MQKTFAPWLLSLCVFFLPVAAWAYLPMFDLAIDAQQRCPYDVVVWVQAQAAVTPYRTQPKSKSGGYVCRQEAINSGYGGLVTHLQPLPKQSR